MTTIIYHAEARRSERIAWLLEELDRPYELVFKPGDVIGSFERKSRPSKNAELAVAAPGAAIHRLGCMDRRD